MFTFEERISCICAKLLRYILLHSPHQDFRSISLSYYVYVFQLGFRCGSNS